MKLASIFLLFKMLFALASACKNSERRYTQGTVKTRIDFSLEGYTFKTLKASSLLSCGQFCLKRQACVSTNFKLPTEDEEGICELNNAGLLDDGDEESLVPHKGVVFSQYAKKEVSQQKQLFKK